MWAKPTQPVKLPFRIGRFCAMMGVDVPRDVMLAGFDDSAESRRSMPQLTTIHIHTQVMAFSAIQTLRTRIKEPSLDFRQVYTETELIYRASTKRE